MSVNKKYESNKKWRNNNLEKYRMYQKNWKRKQRLEIIKHYSNGTMKCARCGFSDVRVLTMDHLNGGGRAHLKRLHISLQQWIINNNYPKGFQVLCQNCQFIKASENGEWRTKHEETKSD